MSKEPVTKKKATGARQKQQKKTTPSDMPDLDKIFEKMDLNNDGRISIMELTKAARYIGQNPTRKEAEQMIEDCNPKEKGYITKHEFKKLFADKQADIDREIEQITEAFKVFDKDGSGTISAEEIRNVLSNCGEKLDESEVDEMIRQCDIDGDGIISYKEFAIVMCDIDSTYD